MARNMSLLMQKRFLTKQRHYNTFLGRRPMNNSEPSPRGCPDGLVGNARDWVSGDRATLPHQQRKIILLMIDTRRARRVVEQAVYIHVCHAHLRSI